MDLTVLASDRGAAPMNLGAILVFDRNHGPSLDEARALFVSRLPGIPRLRHKLRRAHLGCGRPVWVDAEDFQLDRHLRDRPWPDPGGDRELLDVASDLLCRRFDLEHPLWRAWWVSHAATGRAALVLVLHHVLADGVGGLAVLAALADGGPPPPGQDFPQPPPSWLELCREAARQRVTGLASSPHRLRVAMTGLSELGFSRHAPQLAAPTFFNRPTSSRRRLSTVHLPLPEILRVAHEFGGTVNDVILAACSGALFAASAARGEDPSQVVISVPVSGRRAASTGRLGNVTGVRPIVVPNISDDRARLARIVALTSAQAALPRASSAAPLGAAFRLLSRLGLFRVFVEHQRLVNTFETNLRGPASASSFGHHRITDIVPMAVNPGNVGISFVVLSYAGTITVTLVSDPEIVTEPELIASAFEDVTRRLRRRSRPQPQALPDGDPTAAGQRGSEP
jgi:diacylglycerol O-acyltransferase